MKKSKTKKLSFNPQSITELNVFHLYKVVGGSNTKENPTKENSTQTCPSDQANTQTGPPDTYSKFCP
jgi:hypothetical protein